MLCKSNDKGRMWGWCTTVGFVLQFAWVTNSTARVWFCLFKDFIITMLITWEIFIRWLQWHFPDGYLLRVPFMNGKTNWAGSVPLLKGQQIQETAAVGGGTWPAKPDDASFTVHSKNLFWKLSVYPDASPARTFKVFQRWREWTMIKGVHVQDFREIINHTVFVSWLSPLS